MFRSQRNYWIELWEIDANGGRLIPSNDDISGWFYDHNDVEVSFEKSLSSNNDTASISIVNHLALEKIYKHKRLFFDRFFEKRYEVDIMQFHLCPFLDKADKTVSCIFSGDLTDISTKSGMNTTSHNLELPLVAGKNATLREIKAKKYSGGITYKSMVQDLFSSLKGYELTVLDDPDGKLNKVVKKPRTVHGKVSDILNDISTDLDMVWGLDSNPWKLSERRAGGSDGSTGFNAKHAYFADKSSSFDVAGVNGTGAFSVNGSTGKIGLTAFSRRGFSFSHLTDPMLNIGVLVLASDLGSMNDAVEVEGRIDRISSSNGIMNIDCTYSENGKAIIPVDKSHSGALIL